MKNIRTLFVGIVVFLQLVTVLTTFIQPRRLSGQEPIPATPAATASAAVLGEPGVPPFSPTLGGGERSTFGSLAAGGTTSEVGRMEACPELCDYADIHDGRIVYEDHRGPGIEIYGTDLNSGQEFQVIHDTPHQHFPVIYDDIVVYTDLRFSNQGLDGTDVFAMDISTGQEMTVTTAPGQQINLAVGPRYIVWEDDRDGSTGMHNGSNRDIYAYDLQTGQELALATGPASQLHPDIDGGRVVWSEGGDIIAKDLNTNTEFVVSAHWANQLRPAIFGDLVVWEDWRNGNWDIYGYRFSTGEEFPIAVAPGDQNYADISGDLVVWQDFRHGNWDIYVSDIETGIIFPVSRNARNQKWPAVDGTTVVWSDFRELEPHIYGFTYDGTVPEGVDFEIAGNPTDLVVGAYPGGVIELTWQDNTDVETNYVVERHKDMLGTEYEVLANLPANTEAYTDTATEQDNVYWYRIYATNEAGRSATSNESYSVALPAGPYPSEQERYMQVLINEVRADPAKFGYPAYSAQPPLVFNPNLNYAARAHATASTVPGGSGGHVDWADRGPGQRAVASGYEHAFVSENMFEWGTPLAESVEDINRGFLDSHGHRDNMLGAGQLETGLGFYFLPGRTSMWVETFAENVAVAIPALPAGSVAPFEGEAGRVYTYTVNYYNESGAAPVSARVVIDGIAHDMILSTGAPANGAYRFSTTLAAGNAHEYYFAFASPHGNARLPQTGAFSGPQVFGEDAIDLSIYAVDLPQPDVYVGTPVEVTIWLGSAGMSDVDDVLFTLYLGHPSLGGIAVAQERHDVMSDTFLVTLSWHPETSGGYDLYAVADGDDELSEIYEWNNIARTPVTIHESVIFDESTWLPLFLRTLK